MTRHFLNRLLILAAIFVACLPVRAQVSTTTSGSISGIVVSDTGTPIAGATVLYSNVVKFEPDARNRPVQVGPAVNSGTTTGSDGKFAIAGLPSGVYILCALGIKPNQLPPCEWGPWTDPVTVASGGTLSPVTLTVVDGTLLVIRVSDPLGLIRDTAANLLPDGRMAFADGNFRIGVMVGGRYARATFLSEVAGVRQYTVAVPKTSSLNLFLNTALNVSQPGYPSMATNQPGLAIMVTGQSEVDVDLLVQ